jgi:hypothetical protein
MTSKSFYLFLILFFLIISSFELIAQIVDEDKAERKQLIEERRKAKSNQSQTTKNKTSISESDSSKESSPFSERDTMVTQAINSQVYWYDIENAIKTRKDRAHNYSHRFDNEKKLLYRNMSDIFRQQPLWFNYNLMESGRPVYVSAVNSYPHQTSFYYNGIMMNDPIHGMFNSQYIPVNFIRNVQLSSAGNNLGDYGLGGTSSLHVVSSSQHTKAPWSKILYKQGNYGYSDLDISFVQPLTPDIAVQLGGQNRVFDGLLNISDRQGTNYRGELTWQLNNSLFLRGQLFLNRERTGLTALTGELSSPVLPRQMDLRDDYFIDLTWLPTDTITQRLNLKIFNTYSIRRLKDYNNPHYHNRYQFKRYGFDANYNFNIGGFDFLAGGGSVWNRVWGTGFNKQYFPAFYNTYGKLNIPIYSGFSLKPQAQITFDEELDPQLSLSLIAANSFNESNELIISASRSTRFPNATEKYFDFDSLYGNKSLANEDHLSANAKFKSQILPNLGIELTGQYNFIKNEIVFENDKFNNGFDRDYLVLSGDLKYSIWKFNLQAGGFETFSDLYITSRRSGWFKLHYEDIWLNRALGVDVYATVQYWGEHNALKYEPRMERFYKINGTEDDYMVFNWKIVATVQDARIFFEMDNSLSEVYEVINNYQEVTQRWRFGVHWILWD